MELLHSRLRSRGVSDYRFVSDTDHTHRLSPSSADGDTAPVLSTDDPTPDGTVTTVKTLIWEVVVPPSPAPTTVSPSPPPSPKSDYVVVAIRGEDRVDVDSLRRVLSADGRTVRMAEREEAEELSGFVKGCIPPVCHSVDLPLYVEEGLIDNCGGGGGRYVGVGSGTPGYSLHLPLEELLRGVPTDHIRSFSTEAIRRKRVTIVPGRSAPNTVSEPPHPHPSMPPSEPSKKTLRNDPDRPIKYVDQNRDVLLALRSKILSKTAQTRGTAPSILSTLSSTPSSVLPHLLRVGVKIQIRRKSRTGNERVIEIEKNALHHAAWKGDYETVERLVVACEGVEWGGVGVVDVVSTGVGNYGKSPVFFAITQCRDDVVLLLLSHGATLLLVNNKGQTPCSIASNHLEPSTCRILFDAEAEQLSRGGSFVDYRRSRSDGRVYGDLDPRFLRVGDVNWNEDTKRDVADYRSGRDGDDGGGRCPYALPEDGPWWDGEEGVALREAVGEGALPRSVKRTTVWKKEQERLRREKGCGEDEGGDEEEGDGRERKEKGGTTVSDRRAKKKEKRKGNKWETPPAKTTVTLLNGEEVEPDDLDVLTLDDILPPIDPNKDTDHAHDQDTQIPPRYELIQTKDGVATLHAAIQESILATATTTSDPASTSWGIDCEWEPSRTSTQNPIATLQLGTLSRAFVVDLQTLCQNDVRDKHLPMTDTETTLSATLLSLFTHRRVVKVGFGISQDLTKLPASFPHLPCFRTVRAVLDLQTLSRHAFPDVPKENVSSLRKTVAVLLQKSLDKTQQCSGWSRRPLCDAQMHYAALDAAVLPALLGKTIESSDSVGAGGGGSFVEKHRHVQTSYRFVFLDEEERRSAYRVEMGGTKTCMGLEFVRQCWVGGVEDPPPPVRILSDEASADPSSSTTAAEGRGRGRAERKKARKKQKLFRTKANAVILSDLAGDLSDLPPPGTDLGFTKDCCIHRVFGDDLMSALPEESYLSYNRRGGVIEIANAWLLFMNFGVGKFYKKYTNKFLMGGRRLTFTMPSTHEFFRGRLASTLSSEDDGSDNDDSNGVTDVVDEVDVVGNAVDYDCKPILLFIRGSTKEKFFFCGDCSYVSHTEIDDGQNRTDLILEVLRFDTLSDIDDSQNRYLDIVARHL